MRFLCVSDIHGHAAALDTVLQVARARGYDALLACGDHLFPGPAPLETWKLLVDNKAVLTQGVGDLALAQLDVSELEATTPDEAERLERLKALHGQLGELIVARLGKLPAQARLHLENGDEMLVVHGSPVDHTECFAPEMEEEEIMALLGDDPADVIVCGGSHTAFDLTVLDTRIVGVGSVGEAPGGGYAAATFLESTPLGIAVEQITIDL